MRVLRYANLGPDMNYRFVDTKWMAQEGFYRLFDLRPQVSFRFDCGKPYGEVVGTDPRQERGFSQGSPQPFGHLPQERVAARPAEALVDILESLQVDQSHSQPRLTSV